MKYAAAAVLLCIELFVFVAAVQPCFASLARLEIDKG
jgi:hypothetical protein